MKPAHASSTKPHLVKVTLTIVMIAVLAYVAYLLLPSSGNSRNMAYFTTDEGATVFVDSMERLAPFDHNGKPAYRITMFSTDGGKSKFPGYLERCTPAGKARMESALADFKAGKLRVPPDLEPGDTEIKKPGTENSWVSRSNGPEVARIIKSQMPTNAEVEVQVP